MNIVSASFEVLNVSHREPLKFIESVARTCYKSEGLITTGSAEKFVSKLISSGHEAMIEHVSITVKFICDRGVSHEIVRHRLASFAQESTRYCNYSLKKFGNEITVIEPLFYTHEGLFRIFWEEQCLMAEEQYFKLLGHGSTPQEARSVLPNSLKTELIMTANLREWRHFLKLRTTKAAHPQMRELTIPLLEELKELIPIVFDDIEEEE